MSIIYKAMKSDKGFMSYLKKKIGLKFKLKNFFNFSKTFYMQSIINRKQILQKTIRENMTMKKADKFFSREKPTRLGFLTWYSSKHLFSNPNRNSDVNK